MQYLVYAENLTADELTNLMGELSKNYVVGVGTNEIKMASPYKKVSVTPIAREGSVIVAASVVHVPMEKAGVETLLTQPIGEREAIEVLKF